MTAAILSGHRLVPPYGMAGGEPGDAGRNYVVRATASRTELGPFDQTEMAAGDVFVIETPGGGGYGALTNIIGDTRNESDRDLLEVGQGSPGGLRQDEPA